MRFFGPTPCSFLACAAILTLSGCNSTSPSSSSSTGGSNPGSPGNSSSSAAYVYVTSEASGGGGNQIVAYAASANGQLTPVPGSPFNQDVGSMAATNAYLLAASGSDINTYTIGSNGALTLGPQFNLSQVDSQIASQIDSQTGVTSYTCTMGVDTLDPTGQSMYAEVLCNTGGSDNEDYIASFAFNASNGTLSYLGDAVTGISFNSPALPVLGNDEYAYQNASTGCSSVYLGGLTSFARSSSSGLLTYISSTSPAGPALPPGATAGGAGPFGYVPGPFAADNTNHLAIAEIPCFFLNGATPQIQLAVYTANANGSLTTTDTYATMPTTSVQPAVLQISPSGTLLAVGGSDGVQIFHFNGSSSITSFTGVLTTDNISAVAWDNSNHLYALDPGNNVTPSELHVFTVTDSGATEATGSPYTIPGSPLLVQSPRLGPQLAISSQVPVSTGSN